MSHLEDLIREYLEVNGYLVKQNTFVGARAGGGWEMELDIVAFHPIENDFVHFEPSLDAQSWEVREKRFKKKFDLAKKYVFDEMFPWLKQRGVPLRQFAVLVSNPKDKKTVGGGTIVSIDEVVAEILVFVQHRGVVAKHAIPEQFPMLRTLQLAQCGYYKVVNPTPDSKTLICQDRRGRGSAILAEEE